MLKQVFLLIVSFVGLSAMGASSTANYLAASGGPGNSSDSARKMDERGKKDERTADHRRRAKPEPARETPRRDTRTPEP